MSAESTSTPEPGRRRVLAWLAGLGAAISAGVTGGPALLAFLSPAFPLPARSSWVKLGETALLDIGVRCAAADFVRRVRRVLQ